MSSSSDKKTRLFRIRKTIGKMLNARGYMVGQNELDLERDAFVEEHGEDPQRANLTMQFGAKPLFENVSVKFGNGNRYGLIGANGCGKSTLMKILGGDLEPSAGNVSKDPDERIGKLRQDQFAYEKYSVVDTVIMGNEEL